MSLLKSKPENKGNHSAAASTRRRNVKALIPLCAVVVLAACLTIGSTFAYLKMQAGPVNNTFSPGQITYRLNFDYNYDNSESFPQEAVSSLLSHSFTAPTATREGYTFNKWSAVKDGAQKDYNVSDGKNNRKLRRRL